VMGFCEDAVVKTFGFFESREFPVWQSIGYYYIILQIVEQCTLHHSVTLESEGTMTF